MTTNEFINYKGGYAIPLAMVSVIIGCISTFYLGQIASAKVDSDNKEFLVAKMTESKDFLITKQQELNEKYLIQQTDIKYIKSSLDSITKALDIKK